jgi:hypothetical protein
MRTLSAKVKPWFTKRERAYLPPPQRHRDRPQQRSAFHIPARFKSIDEQLHRDLRIRDATKQSIPFAQNRAQPLGRVASAAERAALGQVGIRDVKAASLQCVKPNTPRMIPQMPNLYYCLCPIAPRRRHPPVRCGAFVHPPKILPHLPFFVIAPSALAPVKN